MFKKCAQINLLDSQKRLLIAESELNRGQMAGDMAAMTEAGLTLCGRVKSFTLISSSAAVLVAGLTAVQRAKAEGPAKHSWMQALLKGAGIISTLWLTSRSRGGDHKAKQ